MTTENIVTNVEPQDEKPVSMEQEPTPGEQAEEQKQPVNWEQRYKELQAATQKKHDKSQSEIRQLRERLNSSNTTGQNNEIMSKIRAIEENIALLIDNSPTGSNDEDEYNLNPKPKKSVYEEVKARNLQEEGTRRYTEHALKVQKSMEETLEKLGTDWDDPLFEPVFKERDVETARIKFQDALVEHAKRGNMDNEAKIKEAVAAEVKAFKQEMIKQGLLNSDTGVASGSVAFTRQQIANMTDAEYAKNSEEIHKAQAAGRVK